MNNPKPEHRITAVEKRVTHIEGAIEELASDQAEELKAIRLEIKQLDEGMMSSFKELGGYFELTEKAMATKDDISKIETRIERIETRLDATATKDDIVAMEMRLVDTIKQLWQQRPSGDQEPQL